MSSTGQRLSTTQLEAELLFLEEEYWKRREQLPEEHPKVQFLVTQFIRKLREYERVVKGEEP